MKGVQFVVDEQGNRNAVLIDLSQWGELWEDIYDVMVSQARGGEPQVSWEELKAEMEVDITSCTGFVLVLIALSTKLMTR